MGILSDFFMATPDQLNQLDISRGPATTLPTVQARRIDHVKLAHLQGMMEQSTNFVELVGALDSSTKGDEDGPWVLPVPQSIVSALAVANDDRLAQFATAWADTDEWIADGGTSQDLYRLLAQLSHLVRQTESESSLFVWISL